ncbi:hypothetical protein CesoFtcFv8_005082 [Champsocephalus esox]|uniref:Guanylate cyclase domain-containing protein n=1 Tax=Champsocephalus esox TaxID=159716 RepID=A0AAN8CPD8_9TELE|nr:hypothetical protein CesoFtcFv8_005082 [Champsocephalus esox]
MESTSEALKIQVSGATANLLHTLKGYILTCRGTFNVKGKGDMTTWWLEAKRDDFTDPLLNTSASSGFPVSVSG